LLNSPICNTIYLNSSFFDSNQTHLLSGEKLITNALKIQGENVQFKFAFVKLKLFSPHRSVKQERFPFSILIANRTVPKYDPFTVLLMVNM
jgi:hypothetical protein